ncbi:hypothetical protein [Gordoniibacillus kamchatkensis]|uniref:hypothetical protein n=1 Tax=Gordoniibacillus kamchatkensis TaxID=1590651 RepID=UPI0006971384|nr:hypothetical protein [Paenibacillus sp. VKM B-2647]
MFIGNGKNDKGSASVYFMIVLVPIVAFMSVLADFARIGAADRESELAVKAGLRSVMSAFDAKLHKYGLFGLTLTPEQRYELYRKTLRANGTESEGSASLRYVDTSLKGGSELLQPVVTLGYPDVFRRQALEEMKYRAPLEYVLEVTDKLKKTGMSSQMASGRSYGEDADKLEKLIDKREEALDIAWAKFRRLHDKLNGDHAAYRSRLQELNSLAGRIGLNTMDGVRRSLAAIDDQIVSLQAAAAAGADIAAAMQALLAQKNALEKMLELLLQYTALIAATQLDVKASVMAVTDAQTAMNEALNEAKQANSELRAEWNRVSESASSGAPVTGQFGAVRVMPDEYFTELQADVGTIAALFGAFAREVADTLSYNDRQTEALQARNDAYSEKANAAFASRETAERQRQQRNETVRAKKRQLWSEIGSVLDQAKQAIGGCKLGIDGETDRESYNKLSGYATKYAAGEQSPEAGEAIVELNDPKRIGLSALSLGGMISDALTGMRDAVFVNEYALTHFNYRTFGMEKLGNGQAKPVTTLSEPAGHPLSGQEAEYVTYGFSSCLSNVGAAYGEIFAIRMGVRTLERLGDPQNEVLQLGSPLLVLLAAAAQGAADALQDMNKLTGGDEVALSSKLAPSVTLTYKDYLRLLLLIHGSSERKLNRLQALIELNTGIDLTNAATELRAQAKTSVRLLFLPGGMKLLGRAGMSPCRVEGGRCQLKRSAEWRY